MRSGALGAEWQAKVEAIAETGALKRLQDLLKWVLPKCKAWWELICGKACRLAKDGAGPMVTQGKHDQVLWMADCYTLAKRFPDVTTWMSLLERIAPKTCSLSPFHYWLWKEIWLASHSTDVEETAALV